MAEPLDYSWGFRMAPEFEMRQRAMQEQRDERAMERERAARTRQEELAARFGEDAVLGPTGEIDVMKSAQRQAMNQQAMQVGEAEALSGMSIADVDPTVRQLPGYRRGMAGGIAKKAMQDKEMERQLAVQDALYKRYMDVQALRGQQGEAAAAAEGWENMGRALGVRGRGAQDRTVKVKTTLPGGAEVTEDLTDEQFADRRKEAAREIVDRYNAELDDLVTGIEASTDEKWNIGFDPATGQFTAKPAGWFGGVPKKEAIAKIKAARKDVPGIAKRLVEQVEEEEGLLPKPNASRKPRAAGGMPMSDRQPDAVVRGAVNPQRPTRRFVIVNGEPIPAR